MDSGNFLTSHFAADIASPAVAVADVVTATVDAVTVAAAAAAEAATATVAVASAVDTGAFLRFSLDFFPMMITIQIWSGIIPVQMRVTEELE